MIPTKADLDWLDTDTTFVFELTDVELMEYMGDNQYKDGYKIGEALAEEYKKRFWFTRSEHGDDTI